jgi:hypothetical protein
MANATCPQCGKAIDTASFCPDCGSPTEVHCSEPHFAAYLKRVRTGTLVLCLIAIPIGLSLELPGVWGLAILGVIISGVALLMASRQK